MGKYSNVYVDNLSSIVEAALDEIKKYNLKNVDDTLSNNKTLNSTIENKVQESLDLIINSDSKLGSIKVLKNRLNNLKDASYYIKKYQEAESEIKRLEKKLYKKEVSYEERKNSSGDIIVEKIVDWVIDTYVQNKINSLENDISYYERRIDNYLS